MGVLIQPSSYGVPAQPRAPLSRYGRAVLNLSADIVDCWPMDEQYSASLTLRNLMPGRSKLDTWSGSPSNAVWGGRPSLLHDDPRGRSVFLNTSGIWHAAAYTMPAVGTIEFLCAEMKLRHTDTSIFGNWNGNGVMLANVTEDEIKMYMDGTNVAYVLVAADRTPTVHVATTWDATTQYLYINGIVRKSQAVGSPTGPAGYCGFGVYSNNSKNVYGRFQWPTIYTRPLLPEEIAAHAAIVAADTPR